MDIKISASEIMEIINKRIDEYDKINLHMGSYSELISLKIEIEQRSI